jgi:hypothetical protein
VTEAVTKTEADRDTLTDKVRRREDRKYKRERDRLKGGGAADRQQDRRTDRDTRMNLEREKKNN